MASAKCDALFIRLQNHAIQLTVSIYVELAIGVFYISCSSSSFRYSDILNLSHPTPGVVEQMRVSNLRGVAAAEPRAESSKERMRCASETPNKTRDWQIQ